MLNRSRMPGSLKIKDISKATGLSQEEVKNHLSHPSLTQYITVSTSHLIFDEAAYLNNHSLMADIASLLENQTT